MMKLSGESHFFEENQRETIEKMVAKLEGFDDVQTVYINLAPEV